MIFQNSATDELRNNTPIDSVFLLFQDEKGPIAAKTLWRSLLWCSTQAEGWNVRKRLKEF